MNSCTDSVRSAEQGFSAPSGWTSGLSGYLPREFRALVHRLLPAGPVAGASIDFPQPWQYGVFVDHAVRSQYDILVNALRDGLSIPELEDHAGI